MLKTQQKKPVPRPLRHGARKSAAPPAPFHGGGVIVKRGDSSPAKRGSANIARLFARDGGGGGRAPEQATSLTPHV